MDENKLFVEDIQMDTNITTFFMLKSVDIRVGKNGKAFAALKLGDKTGEIDAKIWNLNEGDADALSRFVPGDLVKVKASVTEWKGTPQINIERFRKSNDQDILEISDYIKAAPEDPEEMYDFIFGTAEAMKDEDLKRVCVKILSDNREKLMYYPAASRNHHAEYAGLLYHVKRMLMTGLKVCEVYSELNKDLVAAGVIIHDICKLMEIESNEYGVSSGYSAEGQLLGHLVMGVKYVSAIAEKTGIPEEKALMLEHMVLSHHYEPEFGSPKKPMFPEAELLHYLDVMDARIYDMDEALNNTVPGSFSERIWTLENRRIYKPMEDDR